MTHAAPLDKDALRSDTPGCAHVTHFNNAGASLPARPVLDAVKAHLDLEATRGGYEAEAAAEAQVERFYGAAAALLGCTPPEIAFAESATRAWDLIFYSLPFRPGDEILVARTEYGSNYIAMLQVARRTGVVIRLVEAEPTGEISVAALERAITKKTRLVALTHVPTSGGLVNPAAEVGRVARAHDVPFLLDACQSVGQLDLDVAAIGCDYLTATGRKYLRGPRGTGLLYVRSSRLAALEPVFLDLRSARLTSEDQFEMRADARRFESWEVSVACKIGLGVALDYAHRLGMPAIEAEIKRLAARLRTHLGSLRGVRVHDLGRERCGIVTFTIEGVDAAAAQAHLTAHGVNVSVSSAAGALLDLRPRGLTTVVRASAHYYNTDAEVDRLADLVGGL